MSNTPEQPNNFKTSVLDRIEREQVSPTPKMWFTCRRCLVWVLWVVTILLGAISVAVVESVVMMRRYDIYEATHDSFGEFLLTVTPLLWFVVFVAMVFLAYQNLRQTKKGYKYPFSHIVLSSIGFSVVGGLLLHAFGVGMFVDRVLGEQMSMYMSQSKIELKLWQSPHEGRLVGVLLATTSTTSADFRDVAGVVRQLDLSELRQPDLVRLFSNEKIRVLGLPSMATTTFYACGVFPWMFDTDMPPAMISKERKEFVERMYAFKDEQERLKGIENEVLANRNKGKCAELEMVRRIGDSM